MPRWMFPVLFAFLACAAMSANAQETPELEVQLDLSQVDDDPELVAWGQQAKTLIEEWHPRLCNLIQTEGFVPPHRVQLVIERTDEGLAYTQGSKIGVASYWIKDHPDDFGMIVHELVHVIQDYRGEGPVWLTEGIADYFRWAIYEGKPQAWFDRPNEPRAYRQGYRVTAGFLLWLEGDQAPGIVAQLNSSVRAGDYRPRLFHELTGKSVDVLWNEYRAEDRG